MSLADDYPIGCAVRLSAAGRRRCCARAATGTVVGYSRKYPLALRVKRDKRTIVIITHAHYWERVPDAQSAEEHW